MHGKLSPSINVELMGSQEVFGLQRRGTGVKKMRADDLHALAIIEKTDF
jgi:hypothetical protein